MGDKKWTVQATRRHQAPHDDLEYGTEGSDPQLPRPAAKRLDLRPRHPDFPREQEEGGVCQEARCIHGVVEFQEDE